MKGFRVSKTWRCLLAATGLFLVAATGAASETPSGSSRLEDIFAEGNARYEKGDYEGAIESYSRLVEAGVENEHLAYNLANAYYRTGDLGRAVLFYERARRLAPRDADVRENLALVRAQLRDKQFVREQNRFVSTVLWPHANLNTREMRLLSSMCYLLLCLLGIVFVFRDTEWVSRAYRWVSLVSPGRLAGLSKSQDLLVAVVVAALVFVSTGVSAYTKAARDEKREAAVVIAEEVSVYSGPREDTTLQFKVHQGTMLRVREERAGWRRVELPGGLSGWIRASECERI